MNTGCKRGCGCAAVLAVVGIGAGGWWLWNFFNPPQIGENFQALSPQQKQQRRAELQQLETQLRGIKETGQRGEKKPFALPITETQLNTLLQDRLNTSKTPLQNVRAGIAPDGITLQGNIQIQNFDAAATIKGTVQARNGQVEFQTQTLQLGGFSVDSQREKIDREVSRALNKALENAPGAVESIELEQGKIVIRGRTK
jgi:hypothetical protein